MIVVRHLALMPLGLPTELTWRYLLLSVVLTSLWCGLVGWIIALDLPTRWRSRTERESSVRWRSARISARSGDAAVVLLLAMLLVLGALHLRVAQLQLVEGAHWRRMAENNRLRRLPLAAVRGRIYDRRGQVLADNLPTWNLLLFPDEARNLDETVLFVADLGVADAASLHDRVNERGVDRLAPMVVGENLDWDQVDARAIPPERSSGALGRRRFSPPLPPRSRHRPRRRSSPDGFGGGVDGEPASSIRTLGSAPSASRPSPMIFSPAAPVNAGWSSRRWAANSGWCGRTAATSGKDLAVTLDAELQQVAAEALGDRSGAVVAIDSEQRRRSGAVLGAVFRPRALLRQALARGLERARRRPRSPSPGSLSPGNLPTGFDHQTLPRAGRVWRKASSHPDWTVQCTGGVVLYGHRFRCWQRGGHGTVNLSRSLEASCDVYYYQLGQRLGIERMARWLDTFGFGRRTGIGLPSEATGLIGNPEWSRRVRGTPWYAGRGGVGVHRSGSGSRRPPSSWPGLSRSWPTAAVWSRRMWW